MTPKERVEWVKFPFLTGDVEEGMRRLNKMCELYIYQNEQGVDTLVKAKSIEAQTKAEMRRWQKSLSFGAMLARIQNQRKSLRDLNLAHNRLLREKKIDE